MFHASNPDENFHPAIESSHWCLICLSILSNTIEGVVAQWCNPLRLQPEQSCGVGSRPGRAPPLERDDKGSRIRLAPSYFCDPSTWR